MTSFDQIIQENLTWMEAHKDNPSLADVSELFLRSYKVKVAIWARDLEEQRKKVTTEEES